MRRVSAGFQVTHVSALVRQDLIDMVIEFAES